MAQNSMSIAQEFQGLPMDALIGGPLMAAANANQSMALTQTKFMLDTCFQKIGEGETANYQPIMINMSLIRGVITAPDENNKTDVQQFETKFTLPLLTIIPLNSLAVESVDITFEMEVKSSFAEDTSETQEKEFKAEASFDAKFGFGCFSATIHGSVSYDQKDKTSHNTHYEKSNSAKYTVAVHAGQLPLPKGVNVIIEAFAGAIQPIQMPAAKTTSAPTTA